MGTCSKKLPSPMLVNPCLLKRACMRLLQLFRGKSSPCSWMRVEWEAQILCHRGMWVNLPYPMSKTSRKKLLHKCKAKTYNLMESLMLWSIVKFCINRSNKMECYLQSFRSKMTSKRRLSVLIRTTCQVWILWQTHRNTSLTNFNCHLYLKVAWLQSRVNWCIIRLRNLKSFRKLRYYQRIRKNPRISLGRAHQSRDLTGSLKNRKMHCLNHVAVLRRWETPESWYRDRATTLY